VDYGDFDDEPSEAPAQPPSEELLEAVQVFAKAQQLSLDMERLSVLPEPLLVNGLAVALPFAPAEKQALLEAGAEDRRGILLKLLRMAEDPTQATPTEEPPVTN
jgi:Lon protease-like protein